MASGREPYMSKAKRTTRKKWEWGRKGKENAIDYT
jgi:hypothetical protein